MTYSLIQREQTAGRTTHSVPADVYERDPLSLKETVL